jgi:hypothetical protein
MTTCRRPARRAALRGKSVVINLWASWCVPCPKEAPELGRFDRRRYGLIGWPTTFVLDSKGRIARELMGAQTLAGLVRAVAEIE